ncbi:MAG: hypothetical protein HKP12_14080 [Gammaproteobacteria bacterium]|nr:hypothetical protein [Gammaproteobacteria bacterium]
MNNLTIFSIALVVLAGCAEFRTHSSFVAHLDNTNILLHEADTTADNNGCYASAETGVDKRNCLDKAVDELLNRQFYGYYKHSIGVVSGLKDEGKLARTEDGTSLYFTDNKGAGFTTK